jgi:hypothetical protein
VPRAFHELAARRPLDVRRGNFRKYLVGRDKYLVRRDKYPVRRDGHIAAAFSSNIELSDARIVAAVAGEPAPGRKLIVFTKNSGLRQHHAKITAEATRQGAAGAARLHQLSALCGRGEYDAG